MSAAIGGDATRRERLRSFGRRQSRKATASQNDLRERLLPALALRPPATGTLDLAFAEGREVSLEIGFGDGGHLAALASRYPERMFLGCEPFWNGVAALLGRIERDGLSNVRVFPDDARLLLDRLPAGSLSRAYILFPDPWPKTRHRRRRLVNPETVGSLARAMRPGGEMLMVSDHADYVASMLETIRGQSAFRWAAEEARDFLTPPDDWVPTKYQRKTESEGRRPTFLCYVRTAEPNVE